MRKYPHPSRLFLFSLHLYGGQEASDDSISADLGPVSSTNSSRDVKQESNINENNDMIQLDNRCQKDNIDVDTDTERIQKSTELKSEKLEKSVDLFFPGTGLEDDTAHNVVNAPIRPLWMSGGDGMDDKKYEKVQSLNAAPH